ncbi:hypothetical protein Tco_0218593 [Tanacetum coccineum]
MTPPRVLSSLYTLLLFMVMLLPISSVSRTALVPLRLMLPLANNISLNSPHYIRRVDSERHFLWNVYRTSSNSERLPTVVKELNEELTQWEYINRRINMIGLFLFGPENIDSILSTIRDPKQGLADYMLMLLLLSASPPISWLTMAYPLIYTPPSLPVRGSSKYCEGVAVKGVSRMKLGSFSKKYHVLLLPSRPGWNDEEAQVCVHRTICDEENHIES